MKDQWSKIHISASINGWANGVRLSACGSRTRRICGGQRCESTGKPLKPLRYIFPLLRSEGEEESRTRVGSWGGPRGKERTARQTCGSSGEAASYPNPIRATQASAAPKSWRYHRRHNQHRHAAGHRINHSTLCGQSCSSPANTMTGHLPPPLPGICPMVAAYSYRVSIWGWCLLTEFVL